LILNPVPHVCGKPATGKAQSGGPKFAVGRISRYATGVKEKELPG
jgi:hypothetical protein